MGGQSAVNEPSPGEAMKADWGRGVASALRGLRISGGPGIRVSHLDGGITISLAHSPLRTSGYEEIDVLVVDREGGPQFRIVDHEGGKALEVKVRRVRVLAAPSASELDEYVKVIDIVQCAGAEAGI